MAVLNDEAAATLLDEAGNPLLLEPAFPGGPLGLACELNLAGTWTDITSYCLQEGAPLTGYSISGRGRANEVTTVSPAQCAVRLNNNDGRFSPRNPTGPYYGQLTRNTPLRVSLAGPVYLRFADDATSSVSAPDTASLQITGDIDIRIDLNLDNWTPSVLCSKFGAAGSSWALSLNADGTVTFTWNDGSSRHVSSAPATLPLGRSMIRVSLAVASGTVNFFTAANMGAAQTFLSSSVVGATSVAAAAGQAISVGDSVSFDALFATQGCQGQVYEFRLYNGIGGTLVANPVFTAQSAGAGSFADAQGNTWTLNGTAALSGRAYRFHGECASLPQAWDVTGHAVYTPVTASGVFRRLQQGSAPLRSVMRRGIPAWPSIPSASMTSLATLPSTIAYWPAEDTQGSTSIASGLAVNTDGLAPAPMNLIGAPGFQGAPGSPAADGVFASSAQLAQVQSSTWIGTVPQYSTNGTASMVTFLVSIPSGGLSGTVHLVDLTWSGGSGAVLELQYTTASGGTLIASALAGQFGGVTGANGGAFMVQMINISTGTPTVFLNMLPLGPGQSPVSASSPGGFSGQLTTIVVNPLGASCGATEVGHIWVEAAFSSAGTQDALPGLADPHITGLLNAWNGETAGSRVARLCKENAIASRIYGYPAASAVMGPQQVDTLANLLQECEDADRGILYEPRQCLGVAYRTLASLCAQPAAAASPAFTLDLTADQASPPLQPVDDDQFTRNDVTVTRSGGTSYEYQVTSGPLSVSAPPAGAGQYQQSLTVYCQLDSQLPDIASWVAHVGTADRERFPQVTIDLASSDMASLLPAIRDADIGTWVALSKPPGAWLPPDTIRLLYWGASEQLGDFAWIMTLNGVPEAPFEVAVFDDLVYGRCDTDGSTLASGVASGATSLSVATTNANSPLWSTAAGDDPFDILIAGEQMTVTAVTGSSSPQTFTVTRSVNGVVKAQAAGAAVSLFYTPVAALT